MAGNGEKKSKKGAKNLIVSILVPIIIVVMLAGAIISVIDGIVEIIVDVVVAITNFFREPLTNIRIGWGRFEDGLARLMNIERFNIDAYLNERLEPIMTISNEKFEELLTRLDAAIDRDTMDITDISIKKMLLTYYRTIYLTSYTIQIELTETEWNEIYLDNTLAEPFSYEEERDENGNLTGKYYLKTTGCVRIINEDGEELYCFTEDRIDCNV